MIIKKLNTVFHKHSRWLFGLFTIVIIVSFMGFLTPGQFGCEGFGSGLDREVGTVYDQSVKLRDLQDQMQNSELLSYVGMGFGRNMSVEQAFQQCALQIAAKRQGLAVSDAEVVKFMRRLPMLQENNSYSPERYKQVKENLSRIGVSDEQLINAIRGVLLIGKLETLLNGEVIVTDNELETLYRQFNVKYTVKAADFKASDYQKEVKNDGAAMKSFFENNLKNYQISGKISGFVVEIPDSDFIAQATAKATDEAVKNFFDTHPGLFAKYGKEGKAPEFSACKAEAKSEFIKNTARNSATHRAYEFATKAYDAVNSEKGKSDEVFQKLAADAKLKIVETGMVDFDAESIGKIKSPELLKNLIAAHETNIVTNPVPGETAMYVGFAREKIQPRPANFNEVSAQVARDYRNAEALKLALSAATKAEESLLAIEDGAARVKAFGELKNCELKEFNFVFGSELPPMEYIDSALAASRLDVNALSNVIPTTNGAQIAILLKRTPADMKGFAEKKSALEANFGAMKRQSAQEAFWGELMSQSRLDPELSRQ
ncbi:MAG: SurA N-terminal domain-containing protein [Victivallales bacterium]|jgi:hypothetical protein|nr:SurA N-terminal domain-containing protein [Victivallales bacterium]